MQVQLFFLFILHY